MVSNKMMYSKYEQVDWIKKELVKAHNKVGVVSNREGLREVNELIDMLESILDTIQQKRDK